MMTWPVISDGRKRIGALAVIALVVSSPRAIGQPNPPQSRPEHGLADCGSCHVCDSPTAQNPCLRPCGRLQGSDVLESPLRPMPSVVLLNELEDRYLPVPFDHQGHAEMAHMTRGCVVCHHYTPEGGQHPACKTCHEINPVREDLRKPGLKGAYHRQCMSCHREWSHETGCSACHQPKTGRDKRLTQAELPPTPGDIVGRMHPPIPEPDTEIYTPQSQSAPGAHVIFRHKEHIHRFELRCVECHHEDNCSRCHQAGQQHVQKVRNLAEHHQPCSACHNVIDETLCSRCHWKEGEPKPEPFNHASTGWPMGPHHEQLGCRSCHKSVRFTALDRACASCHDDWTTANFNHAVTRLALDETHRAFDCTDCHTDRHFDRPPTCAGCHDADEGISYPARRPGQVLSAPGSPSR